jgi:hypothetical protein
VRSESSNILQNTYNHSIAICGLVGTNVGDAAAAAAVPCEALLLRQVPARLQQLSQLMGAVELPEVLALTRRCLMVLTFSHTTYHNSTPAVGSLTLMCVLLLLLLTGAGASAAAVSAAGRC